MWFYSTWYMINVSCVWFFPQCSRWVNRAHAVPHLYPACRSSAAAAARGRSLSLRLRPRAESEMVSTAPRHPALTPVLAAPGNGGAFSALHLSVSQLNGIVSHVSNLSTWTSHLRCHRALTQTEITSRRSRPPCQQGSVRVEDAPSHATHLGLVATRRKSPAPRLRILKKGPHPLPQPIEMCL